MLGAPVWLFLGCLWCSVLLPAASSRAVTLEATVTLRILRMDSTSVALSSRTSSLSSGQDGSISDVSSLVVSACFWRSVGRAVVARCLEFGLTPGCRPLSLLCVQGSVCRAGAGSGHAGRSGKVARGPRPRLFQKGACQADGCSVDLSTLPYYYQRNHICTEHNKCPLFSCKVRVCALGGGDRRTRGVGGTAGARARTRAWVSPTRQRGALSS